MAEKEYYLEFYPLGNSVKVSAVDPVTLTEVSIVGPKTASQNDLQKLAIQKLEYVLKKNNQEKS